MCSYLFDSPILPNGFELPPDYVQLVSFNKLPELTPWSFLSKDMARTLYYYGAMLLEFPDKPLIPFAIIRDETGLYNDGWIVLACFDGLDSSSNPCVRIYDYSTPKISPWENMSYQNFSIWINAAKEESACYKQALAED